ncbi:sunset domain-containing protein [Arthrobacter sp. KNU-44]|uniref:sunset domain-containing protein n=1 Tax=unclassified Arthrobacter TaxID=235627 RepID=UPI003F42DF28
MEWLIAVIVIVLIVAIVWWLLSRNSAKSSPGAMAPASPSPTASSPQMDVTAAALTGSAPLVAATATAHQDVAGSQAAAPEAEPEPETEPEAGGLDVDDWERPSPPLDTGMAAPEEPPSAGTSAQEPMFEEPTLSEPVLSADALSEDALSEATGPVAAEPEFEEGVTADDVTAADAGPSVPAAAGVPASSTTEPATPEQLADSAEWEATWSEGGAPVTPAPIHHREYTDAHAPTLPGAESAAAEAVDPAAEMQEDRAEAPDAAPAPFESTTQAGDSTGAPPLGGHLAADQPYGEGSAAAGADGSGPAGYTVKGNADTMTYHDEDSPSYDEVKAEVWFISSAHAEAAGFRPPRRNRR